MCWFYFNFLNLIQLWRVNKVLQFTRRKINASTVAGPAVALMVGAAVLLIAWTATSPLHWERQTIDMVTGESIGQCQSDAMNIFVPLLGAVVVIPVFLTCLMSWKTKDVDSAYSESSWIFTLIIVQLQVIMVSLPVTIILRDVSTDGRYLGFSLLMWMFPMSSISLIIYPKIWAHFHAVRAGDASTRSRATTTASKGARSSAAPNVSLGSKQSQQTSQIENVLGMSTREGTQRT